mmetsp:Transcript_12502/g.22731  ORF Transcript_12502/g.22731 Transcript_12502/m.22731 type:complete len:80 (-) Transcript_12502:333-572(-)
MAIMIYKRYAKIEVQSGEGWGVQGWVGAGRKAAVPHTDCASGCTSFGQVPQRMQGANRLAVQSPTGMRLSSFCAVKWGI